jgi:hypothetical protein
MKTPAANAAIASPTKWTWRGDLRNCLGAARDTKDSATLEKMVEDILSGRILDDGEISEELMYNRRVPFPAALKLARGLGNDFAYEICSRADATPEALDEFCEHFDTLITKAIAVHQNTTQETLLKMARSENRYTAIEAIKSGRLPESVIEEFAGSTDGQVRQAVAKVSTNPAILRKLVADSNPQIRSVAVENPHTEIDVVEQAATEPDWHPAKVAAAKRSTKPDLLRWLAESLRTDFKADLADALKQNENAPKDVRVFAALVGPQKA